MSYILEALKKSEQERQQGKVPDLSFAPTAIGRPGAADATSRRPYLIVAAVLLAGAAALAWWHPWQAWEAPVTAVTVPAARPRAPLAAPTAAAPRTPIELPVATPRAADVTASAGVEVGRTDRGVPAAAVIPPAATVQPATSGKSDSARREAQDQSPVTPPPTRPVPTPAPVAVHKAPAVSAPPAAVRAPPAAAAAVVPESVAPPQPRPAAVAAPKREPTAPVTSKRVLNFTELAPEVRKSVARIDIAGYSYSEDPQARMVVINDRILREGEEVVPGVRLEKIGSDGIVLSHKGVRFRP